MSLETPIGEEEDSHLGDFIPDNDAPAPTDVASHTLLKEQLAEVLGTLTEREEKVLKLRFGLALHHMHRDADGPGLVGDGPGDGLADPPGSVGGKLEAASEPSEAASFTLLKEQLVDVLSTLTPREEKVLRLRFGIEDGRTRTLEENLKPFT